MLAEFHTQRMVAKVGTTTITEGGNHLNRGFMRDVARQVAEIREAQNDIDILIVSSGAVACGRNILSKAGHPGSEGWRQWSRLGLGFIDRVMIDQVAAAFGQRQLMTEWNQAFAGYGLEASQMLYTDEQLHFQNALDIVKIIRLACRVGIPIINANDVVTNAEMRKVAISADNDQLALHVARFINADTLVLLTDMDGVMDSNNRVVEYARDIKDVSEYLRDDGKGIGSMVSKAQAASDFISDRTLGLSGQRFALIANGRRPNVLLDAARREKRIGTWFATERDYATM